VSSSGLIEEGFNEALPPRGFFTLYETTVRWGRSIFDIAGWAAVGKLKIRTGIGLVCCGEAVFAGQVDISAAILPQDADLPAAAEALRLGSFRNSGRICRLKTRSLVPRRRQHEIVARLASLICPVVSS